MNSIVREILYEADLKYMLFEEMSNNNGAEATEYRVVDYSCHVEDILPFDCNALKKKNTDTIPKENSDNNVAKCFDQMLPSLRQRGITLPFFSEKTKTWYNIITYAGKGNYLLMQFMDDRHDKRKTDDFLHEYEQYKLLSDLTIEGIFIHTQGVVDYANLSMLKLLGYNKNEVIGKNVFAFIHPEDRDKTSFYMTNKSTEPYELRIFHKDGSLLFVEVEAKNFIIDNQERRVVAVRDLTAQKRDAIKHRERDILFSRITDNMTDVIWTADLDLNTTYVSPSVKRILRESPEEHLLKPIEQKYTPESLEKVFDIFQEEMKKEQDPGADKKRSRYIESEHYRGDGSTIWISENISFLRDELGNAVGFVGVLRDITEKKEAEKNLLENENKFRRITETIHDVVYNINDQGVFTYLSPSLTTMLGYEIDEVLGTSLATIVHPDHLGPCRDFILQAIESGQMISGIEYLVKHKNGSWRWHTSSIAPVSDPQGKLTGLIGNASDITDRKSYEAKLKESDQLLKNLSMQVPGMIYQYRLDINGTGCFPFSSENIKEVYEVNPEDVKEDSTKVLQRLHPEDHQRVVDRIIESANNMTLWEDEYRVILPKKGERVLKGIARPQLIENGSVLWHGYIYDNTEQHKKEGVLKESENRFNALINAMEEIVFIKDADLKYIYSNPALEKFFDLPKEQILGKSDYDLMPAEAADLCCQSDKQTKEANKAMASIELVNGRYLETHKFPVTLSNGSTGIGCYIADVTERRNADKELAEKTELLENITENMFDLVSLTDFYGNLVYLNKSHEIFGYRPHELHGINAFSLVHPDDHKSIGLPFYKNIIKGLSSSAEYRYRCADGSYLWIETIGKALKDENGKIKNLLFSSRDITARKKLENTLREREAHLQVMVENPFESIWSINKQGELTFVNENLLKTFETLFDIKLQKGKKISEGLPSGMVSYWRERYEEVFCGKPLIREDLFLHKENKWFLEIAANPILVDGEITGACFYGRDISERKLTELKLKRLAELQNLLMNLASEFINLNTDQLETAITLALGKLGSFVQADRAYIFEYNWDKNTCKNTYEWCAPGIISFKGELQNVPFDQIYLLPEKHHRHEPVIIPKVADLSSDEPFRTLLEQQNIQSIINLPIVDNGQCTGFIGFDNRYKTHEYMEEELNLLKVFTEIYVSLVHRQRLHKSLIEEKDKSDAANKAKSEFLANMSHEIRTPLNGVIGFTNLLLKSGLEDRQKQYAENVSTAGKSLMGIINDILDFSKIEAGKLEIEFQLLNLHQLLNEVIDIVKYQAGAKEIELLLNIPADVPEYITSDPVRLKQILINLINNAVKFTEKGEVELSVQFSLLGQNKGEFGFSIRDTGIGITKEQQKQLFKAFSQADSSTTRKFGGTGLGLIISNLLAEKMHGSINVKSEKGKGSTFTLSIQGGFSYEYPEPFNKKFSNILIVDDNENARNISKQIFSPLCHNVVAVDNGIAAIKAIANNEFDLVVIDQDMPYINGVETLEKLKAEKSEPAKLPPAWLLINPSKDLLDHKTCQKLGIQHQLTKPLSLLKILKNTAPHAEPDLEDDSIELFPVQNGQQEIINYSILIAEDVPMNMYLIKTLVQDLLPEATIHEASTGKEAVSIVKNHHVDLILMDIQMPEMDGYEATRIIRQMEVQSEKRIAVFALTAGALKEERDKAFQYGMDEFLTKPLEAEMVHEVMMKYLNINGQSKNEESINGTRYENTHFDKEAFLKKFNNNELLLKNLAKLCMQDIPRNLKNLEIAVEEGNCQKIKIAAHAVKGQALNMMFNPMAKLCEHIEKNAGKGCQFPVQSVMSEVKKEWEIILNELKQIA
jgi:PAS domain S-box-containing protein